MRRILLAVLGFSLLIGLAVSVDTPNTPLRSTSKGMLFNYEDSTNGVGDFSGYSKILEHGPHSDARLLGRLADISLQRMDHGSGSIERELIMRSNTVADKNDSPDYNYGYSLINAVASSNLVQSPQNVIIGTGYYTDHPVRFNSLLGERTQIKNHASETSMYHETAYARAIKEDLAAGVEDDHYDADWLPSVSLARNLLNLNESVTQGTARIGMLQGRRAFEFSKSALYKPNIDVEQTYTGTFDIATKMNLTIPTTRYGPDEDWLPCCSGGWDAMNYPDQKSFGASAKGVFDCTCFKVPANAQFPVEV